MRFAKAPNEKFATKGRHAMSMEAQGPAERADGSSPRLNNHQKRVDRAGCHKAVPPASRARIASDLKLQGTVCGMLWSNIALILNQSTHLLLAILVWGCCSACGPLPGEPAWTGAPGQSSARLVEQAVHPDLLGFLPGDGPVLYLVGVGPNYHVVSDCTSPEQLFQILDRPVVNDLVAMGITYVERRLRLKRGYDLSCDETEVAEVDIGIPFYDLPAEGVYYIHAGTIAADSEGDPLDEYYVAPKYGSYLHSENTVDLFYRTLFAKYLRGLPEDGAPEPAPATIPITFEANELPVGGYQLKKLYFGRRHYYRLDYETTSGTAVALRISRINGETVSFFGPQSAQQQAGLVEYLTKPVAEGGFGIEHWSGVASYPFNEGEAKVGQPFLDLCLDCEADLQPQLEVFEQSESGGAFTPLDLAEIPIESNSDLMGRPYLRWSLPQGFLEFVGCEAFFAQHRLDWTEVSQQDWLQQREDALQAMQNGHGPRFDEAFVCPTPVIRCHREIESGTITTGELQDWIDGPRDDCANATELRVSFAADVQVAATSVLYVDRMAAFDTVVFTGSDASTRPTLTFSFPSYGCAPDAERPHLCTAVYQRRFFDVSAARELRLEHLSLTAERRPTEPRSPPILAIYLSEARLRVEDAVIADLNEDGQAAQAGENDEGTITHGLRASQAEVYLADTTVAGMDRGIHLRLGSRLLATSNELPDSIQGRTIAGFQKALSLEADTSALVHNHRLAASTLAFVSKDARLLAVDAAFVKQSYPAPHPHALGMFELYNDQFSKPGYKVDVRWSAFYGMELSAHLPTIHMHPDGDGSGRVRFWAPQWFDRQGDPQNWAEASQYLACESGLPGAVFECGGLNYCQ